MIILTLRTDKPEAEVGLYDDATRMYYQSWQAHKALAETIHLRIQKALADQQLELSQLGGVVVFKGPGSFTGLRIGVAVANALASGLKIPLVGSVGSENDTWISVGIDRLARRETDAIVVPEYGALPNVSTPKK